MLSIVERLVVVVRNFEAGGRGKPQRIFLPPGFFELYQKALLDLAAGDGIKAAYANSVLGVPVIESPGHHPRITLADGSESTLHLWPD